MSRVAWSFNGYSFPINPDDDSGWTEDEVMTENVPIGSTNSSIQFVGRKSGRRQIQGWLWGPAAATQKSTMKSWKDNRTEATLIDHTGDSQKAIMVKFEAKPVMSISEWNQGRQTYRYTAEFIARP
jgi:hypothetical protein